jgi:hypothetical protein
MKKMIIAVCLVALIALVGVGAFVAGNQYGQQQANAIRSSFINQRQGGGGNSGNSSNPNGPAGSFGRPAATGTVKSVTGNVVQISQTDGSTVAVTVDSQTTIQKTVNGALSDLQPGERVTVLSDQTGANITARSIQLRPSTQAQ